MLAKLVKKALYLQPEGISEEELKKDGYKEYEENAAPENLPKTQQAVCKLEDTGDKIVARHPDTGYPYECMTSYDGTVQQDWTIDNRTLWKPWHSTDPDYALPWEQPIGAHDMYTAGEYMIWTDGNVYECKQDTNFSPTEYAQAWSVR